jgi:hypothetical protein
MHTIRRVRLAHCKRGPELCEECRQWNVEQICLLELFLPGESDRQMRAIEVEIAGEKVWREFEIVRRFESQEQAQAYALGHGIEIVAAGQGG